MSTATDQAEDVAYQAGGAPNDVIVARGAGHDVRAILGYQAYIRRRMQELTRIVSKAAAGDYSEKPQIEERDDELSQFVVSFRFLLEDLEIARDAQRHQLREIAKANGQLTYQATLLERQTESSPDGILVVDDKGRMASLNARFVQMWGIPHDVVESRSDDAALEAVLHKLVKPDEFLARVKHLYEHHDEESHEEVELRDGRVFDRHSAPVLGRDGTYYGRVWTFRDVTSERAARHELESAYGRLKELTNLKTQFINNVAHELATPLTPLKLQLHMLQAGTLGPIPAEQREAVAILSRSVDRLIGLVGDVLDVARIEADRLRLVLKPVDLGSVVENAVASFRAQAEQHRVSLTYRGEPGVRVDGDADRLTQVMVNLLSNAFKFTPKAGSVDVSVTRDARVATVSVRDTGVGLTEADYAKLFLPFSQAHDVMQRTNAGTGLGLYISQGIIERHGGRIWCTSPGRDQGATFSFTVPLSQAGRSPAVSGGDAAPRGEPTLACPFCQSRDISRRLIKNESTCNACHRTW